MTDWTLLPANGDMTAFDPGPASVGQAAEIAGWDRIAPCLVDPDSRLPLERDRSVLERLGMMHHGRPLLFPERIRERLQGDEYAIGWGDIGDPLLQYIYLGMVKNAGGEHNTSAGDVWYRRHLHRSRELLSSARGLVLDVGCDVPARSRLLFPPSVDYLGIEPGLGPRDGFCLAGMAEHLPVADGTLDGVAFLTSLDHILDYQQAMDEAARVLRPGGMLYLATLIWTHRATLATDTIHFHHFRQYEVQGCLGAFEIESVTRYDWKGDEHRFGVYLRARRKR